MEEFDLIIVGTGSGNMIPSPDFDDLRIALVERDVFGGTCLNRGCIPSKMFVYAADVAASVQSGAKYGLDTRLHGIDWRSIVERVFGRIDPIAAGGDRYRDVDCPNITVIRGTGRFTGHKTLDVDGRAIRAERILLGAGARPTIPPIPGLDDVGYHTSDTIMRIDDIPERLIVLGGGYIAAELGHVFGSFGAEVTFVLRSDAMLRAEDDDVSRRATDIYARRFSVAAGTRDMAFERVGDAIVLSGTGPDGPVRIEADELLVATGRTPNGDLLQVEQGGIAADGPRVITDETMATNVPGIYAFGDLTNFEQLKHLANAEAKIAFHNIASDDPATHQRIDRTLVPHAVFGYPQVAGVGLTESQARAAGIDTIVATKDYGSTAYGWALEDDESFVKLIGDRGTRQLVGAHIIGPQASTLIQQLIQGMRFGQTVDEMAAEVWYIHPALTEVVENALLDLAAPD